MSRLDTAPRAVASGLALSLSLALSGCLGGDPGGGNGGGGGDDGGGANEGGGNGGGEGGRFVDLIRGDPYPRLVIEVDYVPGFAPRPAVESALAEGLGEILDKPGGIEVVLDSEIESRGEDHAWSFAELDALARSSFDLAVDPDTTVIHTLYLDGHHERDEQGGGRILGLAWAHTHIVMFKKTLEEVCGASSLVGLLRERQCRGAELSVWIHEVGHVIGLVDNGLPMTVPRRDEERGAHDENPGCVMYWAYSGEAIFDQIRDQLLGGGDESLGFDDACLGDVAAVRDAP
jgi:hypothetical protein